MRVLLAQMEAASDPNTGAADAAELLDEETDLAVFPELHLTGYDPDRAEETALALDSAPLASLREAAARTSTAVVMGFAERREAGVANSLALIDRDGDLTAIYRKTHLFGAEAKAFEPGDELVVTELAGRRVGPLICFDVEFPEPARSLAAAGAEVLITASANMEPYFDDHLLACRARALDNRRPHLYVNCVGASGGHRFVGGTRFVAPDGRVVSSAEDGRDLLRVELDDDATTDPDVDYLPQVRRDLRVTESQNTGATR